MTNKILTPEEAIAAQFDVWVYEDGFYIYVDESALCTAVYSGKLIAQVDESDLYRETRKAHPHLLLLQRTDLYLKGQKCDEL
jgi:hypothetical protein